MPRLDRRQLMLGGTALGVATMGAGLLIYWQADLRPGELQEKLLRKVGGRTSLRAPDTIGVVDDELTTQLWLLFQRIGTRWQLWKSVSMDRPAFGRIILEKTTRKPSYLTEYFEAGQILDELESDWQQNDSTFDQLFRLPVNVYNFNATRLGRMQTYVIGEFIELLVTYGGFRAFGFNSYRGFAGGPLSDRVNPQYRTP